MPGISSRLLKDLAAAGFHASEYRVLLFCASGEQSQEAIMKELGMKQPNVSTVLSSLVSMGVIEKSRHDGAVWYRLRTAWRLGDSQIRGQMSLFT